MSFTAVMDSGVGGLSVLQKLQEVCPQNNFVYLADHAFCPYGTKQPNQILQRSLQIASFLRRMGASCIVVACNTASVFSVEIRKRVQLPVFDVIFPTCVQVKQKTLNKRVALLATNATVQSGVYQRILSAMQIQTVALPCSEFVPLVENCANQTTRYRVIEARLHGLRAVGADTVVLGCTHFPFLQKEISRCVPNCKILSCSQPVSQLFAKCFRASQNAKLQCFTTGCPQQATAAARQCGKFQFVHLKV